MLKKILIISLLFYSFNFFSQNYEPMLKEGSFWDVVIKNHSSRYACSYGKSYRYKLESDTIINDKTYKKLVKHQMIGNEYKYSDDITCYNPPFEVDVSAKISTGYYLSEDTTLKKVYRGWFGEDNNFIESTFYDFNLKVGDTLKNHLGPIPFVVSQIEYNTNNRKVYNFKSYYDYTITEGIGSDQGIITYFPKDYGWSYELICYGNDNNYNNCSQEILSTTKQKLSSIKVFPNPVVDFLSITNTEDITFKIFSINGSLLKVLKTKTDLEVDFASFSSGIYIIEISSSKGKKRNKFIKL